MSLATSREKPEKKIEKAIYLVMTDAVESSSRDKRSDPILWRDRCFCAQLSKLLSSNKSLALKSMGDALFIIYDTTKEKSNEHSNIVREILRSVWEAFDSVTKQGIEIRAVVHRIERYRTGKKIADHLRALNTVGNKDILVEAMKRDIFGTQVNLAARMLSLVHHPTVLVSMCTAIQIDPNAEFKANKGLSISVFPKEARETLILHSPVPVLYMKGVFDPKDKENKVMRKTSYVIWELGVNDKAPVLAPEFKQNQAFRLISTNLIQRIKAGSNQAKNEINEVTEGTLKRILKKDTSLELRFYTDILWRVEDYFTLLNPSFERYSKDEIRLESYGKSLARFNSQMHKVKRRDEFIIKGQIKDLVITVDKKKNDIQVKAVQKKKPEPNEVFNTVIAFTSQPDIRHRSLAKKLFFSKKRKMKKIDQLEATTIELYNGNGIEYNPNFISRSNLIKDNLSSVFNDFNDYDYVMMFFQVYFENLKEGDSRSRLFPGVKDIKSCVAWGLTSGITDGFVIFRTNDWEEEIKLILSNLLEVPKTHREPFYRKVCPLSFFIMKPVVEYPPLKRNLNYLLKVNDWIKKGEI